VQVTLRNCATNASMGSFNSLVTFHEGGTISEDTTSPTFRHRSAQLGAWHLGVRRPPHLQAADGRLINFDTAAKLADAKPGEPASDARLFAGYSVVTHSLDLSDPNHATSSEPMSSSAPMARRIEPAARRRRRRGSNRFESIGDALSVANL
jgi:hypothetical protein